MTVHPMLARAAPTIPAGSPEDIVLEIKYDGWRCIAHVTEDGVLLRTRSGKAIIALPYIERALAGLPPGTILDGELVGQPGAEWNQAQSVCSRNREHICCPQSPALTYHVFDCLAFGDESQKQDPLIERRKVVEIAVWEAADSSVRASEQLTCTEQSLLDVLAKGHEGVVVKRLRDPYIEDDRGLWLKVKPFEEIEGVCIGTFETKTEGGKFEGRAVGGIRFRVQHEDGTVYEGTCAGKMDDRLREDLLHNPDRYVGRVVEIIHWGVNPGGALRHPNFRRFRDPMEKTEPTASDAPQMNVRGDQLFKVKKTGNRNYAQMKDEKLLASMIVIEEGCGKPNDDRDRCLAEIRQRGLLA